MSSIDLNKPLLACDIDGCLYNTTLAMCSLLLLDLELPNNNLKYTTDDVTQFLNTLIVTPAFDFKEATSNTHLLDKIYELLSDKRLYEFRECINNPAFNVLTKLSKIYDIVFVSNSVDGSLTHKEYLVNCCFKSLLGPIDQAIDLAFIHTKYKSYVKASVFIDDMPLNVLNYQAYNKDAICILYANDFNKVSVKPNNIHRYDWTEIYSVLSRLYNIKAG